MSAARSLRLRKHLNALHRRAIARPYTIEAQRTSHTPEDQALFVRAQDQASLRETQDHLEKLIAHVEKFSAHITALPTTVPIPIRTKIKTKSKALAQDEDDTTTTKISYTTSLLRARMAATTPLATNVTAHAQHLHAHLTDLQHDPYPSPTTTDNKAAGSLSDFEAEISQLTREEKEDLLQNLQYEEEAAVTRLKIDSRRLLETAREFEIMSRKGPGRDGGVRERAGDPFARAEDGARKAAAASVNAEKAKGKEKDKVEWKGEEGKGAGEEAKKTAGASGSVKVAKIKAKYKANWKGQEGKGATEGAKKAAGAGAGLDAAKGKGKDEAVWKGEEKETAGEGANTTEKKPAMLSSLAHLQRRLEESIKSGGS
ncbi:hypothetical protein B0A55_11862 [Friedmanniomyces simplex]|uniref:Uncharacterized protein n=1 Tax=Friedmanniomyces simplex TaxID=329884 RepID=A0A4U0WIE1_9PEZI|nr:hypothetical protein B0A55_11862 [Friedmanniomyces simplex]